jgi:hypothetical protein
VSYRRVAYRMLVLGAAFFASAVTGGWKWDALPLH